MNDRVKGIFQFYKRSKDEFTYLQSFHDVLRAFSIYTFFLLCLTFLIYISHYYIYINYMLFMHFFFHFSFHGLMYDELYSLKV
jgi:hypothetical protein